MEELLNNIPFYYEFMKNNSSVKFNLAITLFQPRGNYDDELLDKAKKDLAKLDKDILFKVVEVNNAMVKFNNETADNRKFDISEEDSDEYRMIFDRNSSNEVYIITDESHIEEWLEENKPIIREMKLKKLMG